MRPMRFCHLCRTVPAVLAACLIGCGGEDLTQPAAATLVFTAQPADATAGGTLAPVVQVAIQDGAGTTVSSATTAVTVALGSNPGSATLSGTTTVTAVAGVATFGDLALERAGSGYTLVASASGLTGATSVAFAIVPAAPTQLGFVAQPSPAAGAQAITPAVQVAVQDAFGNTVPAATDAVTLALGANPSAGTLGGTVTATAAQGIATFADLRIDRPGGGYTLGASAAGLSGATSTPFAVTLTFAAVTTGDLHTCGVTAAGPAYCWGDNASGQLGDGTTLSRSSPVLVAGGLSFAAVTAGALHTCGVTAAGAASCWGFNFSGQLGDGTKTSRSSPVPVAGGLSFAAVTAGSAHTCGVTRGSTPLAGLRAYCWGRNTEGELGDGTTIDRSSPVLVEEPPGVSFLAVTAGGFHTCGVTTVAGDAPYCWGDNDFGQVGDGTTTSRPSPELVAGGLSFAAVTAGALHTCGVTAPGAASCWGRNLDGQLGDGTTTPRLTPVLVAGGLSFAAVTPGGLHTCGVTAAGAASCWGRNTEGQLGDGTTIDRSGPVPVVQ
jgi:alpha-tubulin suppressor-like RCC1 family protein